MGIRLVPLVFAALLAAELAFADTAVCPAPEDAALDLSFIESFACETKVVRDGIACPTCPDLADLQAYVRNSKSNASCISGLRKFACTNSPWKGLSIRERYDRFMELAESVATPLPKHVLVCIAARETVYLDPVSITCASMNGNTTITGLGHMTRSTFEDLFGVDWRTPGEVDTQVRNAAWLAPYNCKKPVPTPREIFATDYQRDPLLQIDAMARVLLAKGKLGIRATPAQARAALPTAIKNYNASPTKEIYARAVLACLKCFDDGGNPVACLDKSSSASFGTGDGKICP